MARRLIIFVPLERIKTRYCDQWYRWFQRDFKTFEKLDVITVMGGAGATKIKTGEWLDVYGTNRFKAQQMAKIVRLLEKHRGRNITIFFMDLWFPGLEALFYIRDLAQQPLQIKGIVHAGSYSPGDLLNRKAQSWAWMFERGWFENVDEIFVGSDYHKELIEQEVDKGCCIKITVVPFPVYTNLKLRLVKKENLVVFPNRLNFERQANKFPVLRLMFLSRHFELARQTQFVSSHLACKTKRQYYNLLSRAKAVVTFPMNENFGIAVKEAENLGAVAVVPNKFAYPEHHECLYETLEQAADKLASIIKNHRSPLPMWTTDTKRIIRRL